MTAPLYVAARRVLLDALDALCEHRNALVLAGAQAIYIRTGSAELDASIAPYTTDADLAIDPARLGPDPRLEEAMRAAGFQLLQVGDHTEPGIWTIVTNVDGQDRVVPVDLLVPETLAGSGRRAARIPPHGKAAARRIPGIEATIVDNDPIPIASLEPAVDPRVATIRVAGTAALIIAKVHKINDRLANAEQGRQDRLKAKDASDVYRLMGAAPAEHVAARLASLAGDDIAGACAREGIHLLRRLFGAPRAPGVELAVQALAGAVPEPQVRALMVAYTAAVLP